MYYLLSLAWPLELTQPLPQPKSKPKPRAHQIIGHHTEHVWSANKFPSHWLQTSSISMPNPDWQNPGSPDLWSYEPGQNDLCITMTPPA